MTKLSQKKFTSMVGVFTLVLLSAMLVFGSATGAVASQLLHNSSNFPSPGYWDSDGGWGVKDGKYGEFTCKTCHGKRTGNIKRVLKNVAVLDPAAQGTDEFPIETAGGKITFLSTVDGSADFGDDSAGLTRTSSTKICEGCHSETKYHRYNPNALDTLGNPQAEFGHYNNKDCVSCHKHKTGFTASCDNCHYADKQLADSHPVHFNSSTIATGNYNTITSTQTEYVFQCGNCHLAGSTSHATGDATPGVRSADIAIGGGGNYSPGSSAVGTDVGPDGSFLYTDGTCSNLYCHSDGNGGAGNLDPKWTVSSMTCSSCHDSSEAGKTMATNAHGAHVNSATVMSDKSCEDCHAVTTADGVSIADKTVHVNKVKDVNVADLYNSANSFSYNLSANECSNVYCHSDGRGGTVTVDWVTGSIGDCVSCHEGASVGTGLSGSHETHLVAAQTRIGRNLGCQDCHFATVDGNASISDITNHVNVNVNVKFNSSTLNLDSDNPTYNSVSTTGAAGSVKTPNTALANCDNLYCHSDGNTNGTSPTLTFNSITWGGAALDCDGCHGESGKAHPTYASDSPGGDDANSHVSHVESSGLSCDTCHETTTTDSAAFPTLPTTVVDGGTHVDRNETVDFNGVNDSGTYDSAAKTCSTTYCHGAGPSPAWGDTALACDACHNAGDSLAKSHGVHYNGAAASVTSADFTAAANTNTAVYKFTCGVCHDGNQHAKGPADGIQTAEVNFNSTIVPTAIGSGVTAYYNATTSFTDNGFSYTKGSCDNIYCHSDGNGGAPNDNSFIWGGALDSTCTSCHDNDDTVAGKTMDSNAHGAHMNSATIMPNISCVDCHTATVSDNRTIADNSKHVNRTKDVLVSDTYNTAAFSYTDGTNTCSAVYCHSDGKATIATATQNWETDSNAVGCTFCHGGAIDGVTANNGGAGTALSDSHAIHAGLDKTDTSAQFSFGCESCHAATVSDSSTISDIAQHIDLERDVLVNDLYNATGGDFISNSCSTTECHGSASPAWTDAATVSNGDCTACHGMTGALLHYNTAIIGKDTNADTATSDKQVGAHVAHLSAANSYTVKIACTTCHVVPDDNTDSYYNAVMATGHIDSMLPAELTFSGAAEYNSAASAYDFGAGTCATTYCHDGAIMGKGLSGTQNVPKWNTAIMDGSTTDCTFCHGDGGGNAYPGGGHPSNSNCYNCHFNVNADLVSFADPSKHIDGNVDVDGGTTCTDCHGGGNYKDPDGKGDHGAHTDADIVLAGKTLDDGFGNSDYGLGAWWYEVQYNSGRVLAGCGQCHPATESTHLNNLVNVDLDPSDELAGLPDPNAKRSNLASAAYNTVVNDACSNVYCHSNGDGNFANSPVWNKVTDDNSDDLACNACHNNAPSTGVHGNHQVGIHYDDLYDSDREGLMAAGASSNAAHGDPNTATTVSCNTCHNATVDVNFNASSTLCNSCHSSAVPNEVTGQAEARIIYNSTTHLNARKDVVFYNMATFLSRGQLRDDIETTSDFGSYWQRQNGYKQAGNSYDLGEVNGPSFSSGAKTCSNIVCHGGANSGVTPKWNTATTGNCRACHTTMPQ